MRRTLLALTILAVGLVAPLLPGTARDAQALEIWSWDDPVFEIDGQIFSVDLGVRQSDLPFVGGAEVVLTVPTGSQARVVYIDTTYFTPVVRIAYAGATAKGQIPVTVDVVLNASRSFDYQILVTQQRGNAQIASNQFALTNRRYHLNFTLFAL